jgi:hypothetical protein
VGGRRLEDGRTFLEELVQRLGEGKPLFTSDELVHYATVLKELFHTVREPEATGRPGRQRSPEKVVDPDLDYATVHKTRKKGRVVKVEQRIVYGDADRIEQRLALSPSRTINTAFVERVNGVLRQLDAHLRRKSLTFAKSWRWFHAKLNLTVAYYNLIRPHSTLSRNPNRTTTPRTPAMLAGLTSKPWTWDDLLWSVYLCND